METFKPDLLFLDVVILSGQGIFKETTDFGSRVLTITLPWFRSISGLFWREITGR